PQAAPGERFRARPARRRRREVTGSPKILPGTGRGTSEAAGGGGVQGSDPPPSGLRPATSPLAGRVFAAFAGITMILATPAAAQTFAITGGTVALGDGSQPIPNGMVVVRNGRIVAAGDVRMKLPAGTQVIDATGKWVTPGIVGGFTRLGLAEVDLSAEGSDDTKAQGPFSAALDTSTSINPISEPI